LQQRQTKRARSGIRRRFLRIGNEGSRKRAPLVDSSLTEQTAAPAVACGWIPVRPKTGAREGSLASEQVRPPMAQRPRRVSYLPAPGRNICKMLRLVLLRAHSWSPSAAAPPRSATPQPPPATPRTPVPTSSSASATASSSARVPVPISSNAAATASSSARVPRRRLHARALASSA
jgi:hypothetical protein